MTLQLPDPGGTCVAQQIKAGAGDVVPGFGAGGTASRYLSVPLRNDGPACLLRAPRVIGVASTLGSFTALGVAAADDGQAVRVEAGGSVHLVIGAWSPADPAVTLAPCASRVSDVTRVLIPLAAGMLMIDLGMTIREGCGEPASMSVGLTP